MKSSAVVEVVVTWQWLQQETSVAVRVTPKLVPLSPHPQQGYLPLHCTAWAEHAGDGREVVGHVAGADAVAEEGTKLRPAWVTARRGGFRPGNELSPLLRTPLGPPPTIGHRVGRGVEVHEVGASPSAGGQLLRQGAQLAAGTDRRTGGGHGWAVPVQRPACPQTGVAVEWPHPGMVTPSPGNRCSDTRGSWPQVVTVAWGLQGHWGAGCPAPISYGRCHNHPGGAASSPVPPVKGFGRDG